MMEELLFLILGTGFLFSFLFIVLLGWVRSIEDRLDELERKVDA